MANASPLEASSGLQQAATARRNRCDILAPYFGSPGLQQTLQAIIVFTLLWKDKSMAEDGVSPVDLSLYGDIIVLDLTSSIRGMHCAKLFADYGADVLLVEPLAG